MAKDILEETKVWIKYFYNNGTWEDEVNFKVNGREPDESVVDFMRGLFMFFMDSNFLSENTKIWLRSHEGTVKAAVDNYNNQVTEIERVNENTVKSNITYDKNKVKKYFDNDTLFKLMHYPEDNLEKAQLTLDKLCRVYMNDKSFNRALVVKLPKDCLSKTIDDTSWAILTEYLTLYSKKRISIIEEGNDTKFNTTMIGYYNYLISSKNLNKSDRERLKIIKGILGIEV